MIQHCNLNVNSFKINFLTRRRYLIMAPKESRIENFATRRCRMKWSSQSKIEKGAQRMKSTNIERISISSCSNKIKDFEL